MKAISTTVLHAFTQLSWLGHKRESHKMHYKRDSVSLGKNE